MTTSTAVTGMPTWARRLGRARAERRAYRATLAELTELSERQLRDIGLTRAALPAIARKAAREI